MMRASKLLPVILAAAILTTLSGYAAKSTIVITAADPAIPTADLVRNFINTMSHRVDLTIGIGYGDDMEKAQGFLQRIVAEIENVLKDPGPVVQLHELADTSVNFVRRPWVATGDYWEVHLHTEPAPEEKGSAENPPIQRLADDDGSTA